MGILKVFEFILGQWWVVVVVFAIGPPKGGYMVTHVRYIVFLFKGNC